MELGQKLKQARLEAGLSQRQLCGGEITRNMLSQIENGSARPSMDTLRYLAQRLGKTVSWFLEEDAVTSPNQAVMERARAAFGQSDFRGTEEILARYRAPDPVFDMEKELLSRIARLELAEEALQQGKPLHAVQILEEMGPIRDGYCPEELERRRLLTLAKAHPKAGRTVCGMLPPLDEELMLRSWDALGRGDCSKAEHLLEAAEDRGSAQWNYLRGELYAAQREFAAAAPYYRRAESMYPRECAAALERCYREMGDYERAYYYACKQRYQ